MDRQVGRLEQLERRPLQRTLRQHDPEHDAEATSRSCRNDRVLGVIRGRVMATTVSFPRPARPRIDPRHPRAAHGGPGAVARREPLPRRPRPPRQAARRLRALRAGARALDAVHADEAEAAPGVVAVFTGATLGVAPHHLMVVVHPDFAAAPIATDRVRFVGDPIALVVAESFARPPMPPPWCGPTTPRCPSSSTRTTRSPTARRCCSRSTAPTKRSSAST